MYEGYLADGVTALRKPVRVTLAGQRLQILDERGHPIDTWPFAGIRLSEEVYRGQPLRFVHRDKGDASLSVSSHAIFDVLTTSRPGLRRVYLARISITKRLVLWRMATLLVAAGTILAVPHLDDPLARMVPMEWETALGETVANALTNGTAPCNDPAGEAALQKLVARLAHTVKTPYRFKVSVTDREMVNAFAAPGGHIVVFNGLIESAKSAEEVAGVVAHEMGHVVQRHSLEGMIRSMGLAFAVSVLVGDASAVASGLAGVGERLLLLAYSRADEAEADRVAVAMLNGAGISSRGLVGFFTRLQDRPGDPVDTQREFLSSHPPHRSRIEVIKSLPQGSGSALDHQQWQDLKNICG